MIKANPLLDKQFIVDLSERKDRVLFARITALTQDEKPIEYIEGKVTGGSVNIDGASAVRRTCSLSMVAKDVNINSFYWGLTNKFTLELGLQNNINPAYDEIVWFPMGLYIINSFNTSLTTNNYNISISGKDKMCMLNGEVGGALPHSTDFGAKEYYDKTTNITTYEKVLIKDIIREAVQHFGNELVKNIIINDIEDCGVEIIEYKGDEPLYLYFNKNEGIVENLSFGNQEIVVGNETKTIKQFINEQKIIFDNFTEDLIEEGNDPTVVKFPNDQVEYTLIQLVYGTICGYRETDLVYAGELISGVGESITSILDKIVSMLGQFEYFYDLQGRFVFQKKQIYIDSVWNDLDADEEVGHYRQTTHDYSFTNSNLITSFSNTPNLLNVRNDFTVWGIKEGSGDAEIPIHMRYAIDKKPSKYNSFRHLLNENDEWIKGESIEYSIEEYDWRELIYQMALDYRRCYHNDDFLYYLSKYNPQYPEGKTGYEQYYIDLEGFWRLLYDPKCGGDYIAEQKSLQNKTKLEYDEKIKKAEEAKTIANNEFADAADQSRKIYDSISDAQDDFDIKKKSIEETLKQEKEEYQTAIYEIKASNLIDYTERLIGLEEEYDLLISSLYGQLTQLNTSFTNFKTAFKNYSSIVLDAYNQKNFYDNLIAAEESSWDKTTYWNTTVIDNPGQLIFWFDFLDGGLEQFSNFAIGNRPKPEKDDNVKTIIYSDIPNVIFKTIGIDKNNEREPGYTYISIPQYMYNAFSISSMAKSAKEVIDEMLYKYGYCNESVSVSSIPLYFLQPNTRIYIRDNKSGIDGDYIIDKINIPLTNNGVMQINAIKAISTIN